jgi:hypothetical protein
VGCTFHENAEQENSEILKESIFSVKNTPLPFAEKPSAPRKISAYGFQHAKREIHLDTKRRIEKDPFTEAWKSP